MPSVADGSEPWRQRVVVKPLDELPPIEDIPPVSELPPTAQEAANMKWEFSMGGLSLVIMLGTGYLLLYEFGYRRRRLDTAASHRPLQVEQRDDASA